MFYYDYVINVRLPPSVLLPFRFLCAIFFFIIALEASGNARMMDRQPLFESFLCILLLFSQRERDSSC